MSKSQPKRQKHSTTQVTKLPPTSPAARDEGPRLIPLPDKLGPETELLQHYLELAEGGTANKKANKKTR